MKRVIQSMASIALLAVAAVSAQARYLQPDPLGLEGGGPNVYVYAGNDPVQNVDPDGLQFLPYSRNLNRTSLHPDKLPDAFAQRLNVHYVMGAGFGFVGGYMVPTLGPPLVFLGPRIYEACMTEEVKQAIRHCTVAIGCILNNETTNAAHQTQLNEISQDSRTRKLSPSTSRRAHDIQPKASLAD